MLVEVNFNFITILIIIIKEKVQYPPYTGWYVIQFALHLTTSDSEKPCLGTNTNSFENMI